MIDTLFSEVNIKTNKEETTIFSYSVMVSTSVSKIEGLGSNPSGRTN